MNKAILQILEKYGQILVDNYKDQIAKHRASGNLERSIKFNISGTNDSYKIQINLASYYAYLENGRPASKFPPIQSIINWIRVKNIVPKPYAVPGKKTIIPSENQLAFLIARSIAKNGLPAHNYMQSSIEFIQDKMIEELMAVTSKNITTEIINNFNN